MERSMVKTIVFCALALVLTLTLGGISQAAPKSIKVSAVISLTGKMSGQGIQLKEAYDILVEKINNEGGVFVKEFGKKLPIEFRVLDDESDGQKTQTQLETANSWGAVANMGGLGCGSFEMGTPIAQKNRMTWIGPGCGGYTPHLQGNDWLFSVFHKTITFSPLI
ncbi:ABC transporter substrate-binding protein, partial [Thermodesulfobacteriota bacterium]